MTNKQRVLNCLAESGRLTMDALSYESDLDLCAVANAVDELTIDKSIRYHRGAYQLFDALQSKRIKNGLLVASIPSICG